MATVVPRSAWGARPWAGNTPDRVPTTTRRWFLVHYDGATPITATGPEVPRRIDAIHRGNGWAGIGYSFVVDQAGAIYEGRGWDLHGAHCPGRNTDGYGVQVAIGGDQHPTPAALRAVRALYDEACRRTGRTLTKSYHSAHYATECPGPHLKAWVDAGMPAPSAATPDQEDDMQLAELAGWDVSAQVGEPAKTVNFQTAIGRIYKATVKAQAQAIDYAKLADALAARGVQADPDAIAKAVIAHLADELTS